MCEHFYYFRTYVRTNCTGVEFAQKCAHSTEYLWTRTKRASERWRKRQRARQQIANIKQIVSGKDIINISMISRKLALITETIFGRNEKKLASHRAKKKREAKCRRTRSVPTHVYGLIALLTEPKKCTHFNKCAWAGSVFKPSHFTCDFFQFRFWHTEFWCKATVQCCWWWSLYRTV